MRRVSHGDEHFGAMVCGVARGHSSSILHKPRYRASCSRGGGCRRGSRRRASHLRWPTGRFDGDATGCRRPASSVITVARASWAAMTARAVACTLLAAFSLGTARAQHASDDPVASASDGFGLTLGLETIGLYGPGFVRGFNPQTAGNVRIDGLYFDQQGALSNRVVEGSTIRVGISAIGYAFPAPTGIVDYDLRHVGNGTPTASVVVSGGPFEARGVSVDAVLPVAGKALQLPVGAAYSVNTGTNFGPQPGYTSRTTNFGAVPAWTPNDRLTFRAIFDWSETTQAKTVPVILT